MFRILDPKLLVFIIHDINDIITAAAGTLVDISPMYFNHEMSI